MRHGPIESIGLASYGSSMQHGPIESIGFGLIWGQTQDVTIGRLDNGYEISRPTKDYSTAYQTVYQLLNSFQ